MNYRTISDLNRAIVNALPRLPRQIDLVVGVPRSGMIPATIIALALNAQLVDLNGYLTGESFSSGKWRRKYQPSRDPDLSRRVIIVDDSVCTGREMRSTIDVVKAAHIPDEKFYLAVYGVPHASSMQIDYILEECPLPRVFEWNLFHHTIMQSSCVDIDGVLCLDPSDSENDDSENYGRFIETVRPKWIPTVEIAILVSCRLEKYRSATEKWLAKHSIHYKQLRLMNYASGAERRAANNHAEYKAEVYSRSDTNLFVESSIAQAEKICRLADKPVLCTDQNIMLTPSMLGVLRQKIRHSPTRLNSLPSRILRRLLGRLRH